MSRGQGPGAQRSPLEGARVAYPRPADIRGQHAHSHARRGGAGAARLDDLLEVTSRIGERKRASFTFFYEIRNEARQIVATGHTRHVCLNPATTKMIALPDWLKASMPDAALDPADR